jgi:Nif-specific ferredoxin III
VSEVLISKTFGGFTWTPLYVEAIDASQCLGCGQCVKLCGQHCLSLESFTDDTGTERFIAQIANKSQCIGCQACGRICERHAYIFKAKTA